MEEHPKLLWLLRGILICLALLVGLLLLVNLPMLSGQANKLTQVISSILYGLVYAYLLDPFVRWVDKLLLPRLQKTKLQGTGPGGSAVWWASSLPSAWRACSSIC